MQRPWCKWHLEQWLLHLENRNAQEIQLGLDRILTVAKKINVHLPKCKVITVGGTNGKGSTVSALETIYHAAGYKVGAYTSPHLVHFNERIRVNLTPISDDHLCEMFCFIEEARGSVHLTYFEMTTLAALLYFQRLNLDIMVLEVGLGGRLDATNIIDADLAIITTVDYDHQDFLGNTLEEIAYEKAGILRPSTPFIYADNHIPSSITDKAGKLAAPGFVWQRDFFVNEKGDEWDFQSPFGYLERLPRPKIQLQSAAASVMASVLMNQELPVSHGSLRLAMQQINLPGRLEFHPDVISTLYDVAHNPQSVRLLAERIPSLNRTGKVHAVFSALKDKDILGLILPLRDCVDRWYPAQLTSKRASGVSLLLSAFENAEIFVDICYTSPFIAYQAALNQASPGDLIVVYGSFFTVGHVMAAQHHILEQKENL